jgi:phosphoglycolate phosphatase
MIGLSLDDAFARLLDGTEADIAAMREAYKQSWLQVQARPELAARFFAGMRELLDTLAARDDMLLGIVTGKSRRGVSHLIEMHGLERHFQTRRTADDCPSKPHPAMVLECCAETGIEPRDTFVIGDTVFDMEMARNAGAGAIGVGWGYHDAEALRRAGASTIAQTADEIAAFLSSASMARMN